MFYIQMKLLSLHQGSNFSITFLLWNLILIILCMSMLPMDVNCVAVNVDHEKANDRLALLAFKDGITQDPLGVLSTWNNNNDSIHYCEWRGVTCSRRHRNRVTVLDLNSQGLVGSISPNIGNLSFLKELVLYNNSLSGEIPQQIGRLFRLEHLDLESNSLEGGIPENISLCSNLEILVLSYNNLSGEIPTSLGNLSSSLIILNLGYNFNLEGRIPSTLCQLTSLVHLNLDSNRLSGIVPPSLYNISSLESLSLFDNQLHGSIPFDIGLKLPNLDFFALSKNNISGTFPNSFSNMSKLEILQLSENNLVGSVPYNLCNSKSLEWLQLEDNKLGSREDNDLNFLDSLVNCTSLKVLFLGYNKFGGALPISIANFTETLDILDLRENLISGSIPAGIQNVVGLTALLLGSNQLTGTIPPGIGLLQNLGILDLDGNKLFGPIPSSLGNLTRLIELYLYDNKLTGLIPSSLGNCKSLQVLNLQTNRLNGSIPKQVFQLPSLSKFLSLAKNSFTGSLPAEIGNLKHLGVFDLSENKLAGEIPYTIGQCLSLTNLYLDGNFFQGNIPPAITFLKGLEVLNLSRNNLSGIIPKRLENLTTLIELDLSHNNLEEEVPKHGVFKNLSAFSIDGNSKLCGGVPELELPNCSVPINPNVKHKQRKSKHVKVLIISIVIAVLLLTLFLFSLYMYSKGKSKPELPLTTLDVGNGYMGVSYNELLKATNGFNNSTNLLGVGCFGSVYKGILQQDESTPTPVAVKVIHLERRGATKSFLAECDALRKVRHRNLLKIVTCCSSTDFQGNPFKALVFEFMPNGSLENWLHPDEGDTHNDTNNDDQVQPKNLNLERRLSIAVEVASALTYLHHDSQSPIAHCDLKPSNVLLDDDLIAHVGDFGLAKFLSSPSSPSRQLNEQDTSSIAIKGSIGYVSPEYGMGGEVSTQGDVYSYGILLLEMFTGKRPTDGMFKDGLNIHNFCKMHELPDRVEEVIDTRLLSELREHHSDSDIANYNMSRNERRNIDRDTMRQILASIIQIGVKCSSELPSDRDSMNEVVVDVQAVKNQYLGVRL